MSQDDKSQQSEEKQLAVALNYDEDIASAPRIVATGKGNVAAQIIAIAEEHGITVHEDADLAGILSVLEVDSVIPLEAYAAVAEILAYIYKKNAKTP